MVARHQSLTGPDTFSKQEWHHRFLNDTINSPLLLAAQINYFFSSITHEFEPLTQDASPNPTKRHFIRFACLSGRGFIRLTNVANNEFKAVGPDGISNNFS